ncbi:cadherin domain-containing protein [Microvirga sp. CF3016]|uniref:cadherin domain-containing protein n=1 Tax=Microvirga sp. CF3016 TaxID=3110181 RepID=UPI002E79242D|nr:cadherin domain-containing protein [Microvirga sp. CF3016]MEE1612450.1 cadherin domain-containing protein [Microvirga sp. CF3016]
MNKPVFENVIGEAVDVGNVLDDTLAGGAAAHIPAPATPPAPNDAHTGRALDLPQDEKDGRRSIEAASQAPVSSHETPRAQKQAPAEQRDATVRSLANDGHSGATSARQASNSSDAASAAQVDGVSARAEDLSRADNGYLGAEDRSLTSDAPSDGGAPVTTLAWQTVPGTPGDDTINYRDAIIGPNIQYLFDLHHGNDICWGSWGSDQFWGGHGDDYLVGFGGNDTFWGGEGNDTISWAEDTDVFSVGVFVAQRSRPTDPVVDVYRYSGPGEDDVVHINEVEAFVLANDAGGRDAFYGNNEDTVKGWTVLGMAGGDGLRGGGARDILDGGFGSDAVEGMDGNDVLFGSRNENGQSVDDGAVDVLWGGGGDDWLEGSANDVLIGDLGNDTLVRGWVRYDTYTYVHPTGGPTPSSFNFTYTDDNFGRTVNLVTGKVIGDGYTDSLIGVHHVSTGNGADKLIAAAAFGAWFEAGGGNDSLYGGASNDTLHGGTGDDTFYGSGGNDTINGQGDSDTLDYSALGASVIVDLASGYALKTSREADVISGIEHVIGTNFSDPTTGKGDKIIGNGNMNSILAGAGGDTIDARGGNDFVNGEGGDDSIAGGDEDDALYGGDGKDTLDGGNEHDKLYGWIGDDLLMGGLGNDELWGEWDNDLLLGGGGDDTLDGGEDNDVLQGEAGLDNLRGGVGNDKLFGGADADTLDGGRNDDLLEGGTGNDSLVGGSDTGNDILKGGDGADTMAGGAGNDEYHVDNTADVIVEVAAVGVDTIYTSVDWDLSKGGSVYVENLTAEDGFTDVKLTGNASANLIIGNSGKNEISGGGGADTMRGKLGNDTYHIDSLDDIPQEYNGETEGWDTAFIYVKNFDARKLANIEDVRVVGGGSVDEAPEFTDDSDTAVTINEISSGIVAHVEATDDGNGGTIGYELLSHADKFDIDEDGNIVLKAPIDYETTTFEYDNSGQAFLRVVVRATESETTITSDPHEVWVYVQDSNEAPTSITYSGTLEMDEDALPNTPISLPPDVTDPDAGDTVFLFQLLDLNGNILNDQAIFMIDPETGVIRRGNGIIPDATVATDYQFFVRVIDRAGDGLPFTTPQPITITVHPVENHRPGAPALLTDPPEIAENTTGSIGQVRSLDDNNGGPLRYRIVTGDDKFDIDEESGQITLTEALDYESLDVDDEGNHYIYVEVQAYERDAGKESDVTRIKVIVTNANDAPSAPVLDGEATVAENPGDNTVVGRILPSIDQDGDAVSFVFASNIPGADAGGRFLIDANGNITAHPDAVINYEAFGQDPYLHDDGAGNRWYELWVVATDGQASSAPVKIIVEVTDANDKPTDIALSNDTIREDAQQFAEVGELSAVDEDGHEVSYLFLWESDGQLHDTSEDGAFAIAEGRVIVQDPRKIQIINGDTYKDFKYTVVASDGYGGETPVEITIRVNNVNPNNKDPYELRFADGPPHEALVEENDQGAVLGILSAKDDDNAVETLKYTIADDPSGNFEIVRDEATGKYKLKLKDGVALDYEAEDSYTVTVKVEDPQGAFVTQNFTINVDDVWDLTNHDPYSLTFDDNQTSAGVIEHKEGAIIGTLLGKDEDANDAGRLTYHIQADVSGKFDIVDNVLKLKEGESLDRTTQATYTVVVRVADAHGGHRDQEFTINVLPDNDGNQRPTNLTFDNPGRTREATIDENQRGIDIGALLGEDPDNAVTDLEYSIAPGGDSLGYFEVVGSMLKLKDGAAFDYEKMVDGHKYYEITLRVTDPQGDFLDKTFKINIDDVTTEDPDNNDPTSLTFITGGNEATVREHQPGVLVGVLMGQDADAHDLGKLRYELRDDATKKFKVVGNELRLKEDQSLDVDEGTEHNVTVRVWDAHGGFLDKTLTVNVVPENTMNQPPRIVAGKRGFEVADNSTVKPFEFLSYEDAEDDILTVSVIWAPGAGKFQNVPDLNDPANAGVLWDYVVGDNKLLIKGTEAQINRILQNLRFNPTDRPQDAGTASEEITTEFKVFVVDSGDDYDDETVLVTSKATGQTNDKDDIYHIRIGNEFIYEPAGDGNDIAYVHINGYALGVDVEIETVQVASEVTFGVSLSGSQYANTLIGGIGDDTLWGVDQDPSSPNQDVLRGGAGDDTYIIKYRAELGVAIEELNGNVDGIDTVKLVDLADDGAGTEFTGYTLGANLENLDASETDAAVTLTGNGLGNLIIGNVNANTLVGGAGNDTLDGTAGAADRLEGGADDDTYRVHSANDVVVEGAGGGTDTVEVFGTEYHLGQTARVETLKVGDNVATGVKLIGNAYSATIMGGSGQDTLDGSLSGRYLQHTLNGGGGNDVYHIVHVGRTNEESDQIDGEMLFDDGWANGRNDKVILYRGLFELLYGNPADVDAAIESAKVYYRAQGIEDFEVLPGLPPDDGYNQLPVLTIAEGTKVTNATDNGLAVYLFRGVDLSDHENDNLTVTIRFLATTPGVLNIDPNHLPTDSGEDNGFKFYTWTGKADELEAILRALSFNPDNDSAPVDGFDTDFEISVQDEDPDHEPVTGQVTVHTKPGDDSDNEAPVLKFAPDTQITNATNKGLAVFLLRGIDLLDKENDTLTVSISFRAADGALAFPSGVTALVSTSGEMITYTFTGKADQLDAMLRKITFNPEDNLAQNAAVDTIFTITVQDEKHGPVTGAVTVRTTDGTDNDTHEPEIDGLVNVETPENVPVALFEDIDLTDEDGDKLTAIITFAEGRGDLLGAGNTWSVMEGVRTYIFSGTATELENLLKGFTFDPSAANEETNITLSIQDGNHPAVAQTVKVTSLPANGNTAPTAILLTSSTIREHAPAGLLIGTLSLVDPDGHIGTNYTLKDTSGRFAIDSVTKQDGTVEWRLKAGPNGVTMDSEQGHRTFTINIEVDDGHGAVVTLPVTVSVRNIATESVIGTAAGEKLVASIKNDSLDGRGGSDILVGGAGEDFLTGGQGADAFVFDQRPLTDVRDKITDFSSAQGDQIQLVKTGVFTALAKGALGASAFYSVGVTAGEITENTRVIYDQNTEEEAGGALYYDADGSGDEAGRVLIAILQKRPTLTHTDILVI